MKLQLAWRASGVFEFHLTLPQHHPDHHLHYHKQLHLTTYMTQFHEYHYYFCHQLECLHHIQHHHQSTTICKITFISTKNSKSTFTITTTSSTCSTWLPSILPTYTTTYTTNGNVSEAYWFWPAAVASYQQLHLYPNIIIYFLIFFF